MNPNLLTLLPARYAKMLAAAIAALVTYVEAYSFTWHPVAAFIAIGGILGVFGVPNTSPATAIAPPAPPAA